MDDHIRAHFERAVLITVDTQRDTLDGQPMEVPGTSAALPAMRKLTMAFRRLNKPIVHIVRIYKRDASNVDLCRRAAILAGRSIVLEGTPGMQLASELFESETPTLNTEQLLGGGIQQVGSKEVIIYKPRWGAFYQTPLEQHLRDQDIDTIVFAGCNFPNCPRTSIYEASERDFRVVLVEDALSGLYDRGCAELTKIGVLVMSTADVLGRAAAVSPRKRARS